MRDFSHSSHPLPLRRWRQVSESKGLPTFPTFPTRNKTLRARAKISCCRAKMKRGRAKGPILEWEKWEDRESPFITNA